MKIASFQSCYETERLNDFQVYATGKESVHKAHSIILNTWQVLNKCSPVLEVAEPGFKLRSPRPMCFTSCHLLYYHLHKGQLHRNKEHLAIYAFLGTTVANDNIKLYPGTVIHIDHHPLFKR